jgi:hypothetical protein
VIVPPPPVGNRPWAAPTVSGTYLLSDTAIDSTGASDVSAAMIAFLDSVPDGSTIDFDVTNGVYRMASGGLLLQMKNHLKLVGHDWTTILIEGNGADEARSAFLMRASNHIWVDGFYVIGDGVNVTNGHASEGERAHVLGISGFFDLGANTYIEMSNVHARNIKGDGVYVEGSNGGSFPPAQHVWVRNNEFDHMGRNGVSLINAEDVIVENNVFDHISYHVFDYEANFAAESIDNTWFRNNAVGSYAHRGNLLGEFVADVALGAGSVTSNAHIIDNTVVGTPANGYNGTPRGLHAKFDGEGYPPDGVSRHNNIEFARNATSQAVPGAVIRANRVDGFNWADNSQPLSSGTLTSFTNCTGVVP